MTASPTKFQLFVSLSSGVNARARNYLKEHELWTEPAGLQGVHVTCCTGDRLREVCLAWLPLLQPADLTQIRCHVTTDRRPPSAGALMHSRDLQWLLDWLNGRWLRDLLRAERLVTYFQPIVHLHSRSEVFAVECLARGQHTDGSVIPPDQLFGTARATGQLAALDQAAQLTAVRTAARLQLESFVFVNFSPRCLTRSTATLEQTIQAAHRAGLSPDRLIFEVVESDQLEDISSLNRVLTKCREAGSRVALDDIGAGYNSLTLMAELRPDFIKIDRALVRGIDGDMFKRRVVSKLIELSRELNISTVVEGIETEAEWDWAVDQGAQYGQGYLLGLPSPDPPSGIMPRPAAEELPTLDPSLVSELLT